MSLLAGLAICIELIKKKMKELEAISEETAKKPKELGTNEWLLRTGLADLRGIKRTKDDRYYLVWKDEKHC